MIVTETEAQQDALLPVQRVPKPRAELEPAFRDLLAPAFRQQNVVGSAGSALQATLDRRTAEARARFDGAEAPVAYDPFNDIQGYEFHAGSFRDAETPEDVAATKRRIDRERDDRRMLEAGGAAGVVAQVIAGVVDPINLIPVGGTLYRSARLGDDVLQGAIRTARAGAVVAVAAEAALQATQETRTGTESAITVGASALISGILGAAAPLVREALPSLSARVAREIEMPAAGHPDPFTQPGRIPLTEADLPTSGSAGAMRAQQSEAKLKSALGVEHLVGGTSPGLRTALSPSASTRRTAQELVEQPFYMADQAQGVAAPIAAETRIKFWQAPLAESLQELDRLYLAHRQGNAAEKLGRKAFNEEVGKAMRELDSHHVPEVQQAARTFRAKVFDPLKDQAVMVKLLPEDIQTKGAPSYLSRVYNVQKISTERPDFVRRLAEWMQGEEHARVDEARVNNRHAERIGDPRLLRDESLADPLEIRETAEEITDHILGVADGRIAYETVQLARGPLKERLLDIPDFWIQDFLESDVELISKFYTRTMAPDVEITRAFGSVDMAERIAEIRDSYKDAVTRAGSEKERVALGKRRDADIRDLAAMRDRLRGTYAAPADPSGFLVRTGQAIRNWNYLSLMGSMVVSSIPDLARPVMIHGVLAVLRDGIVPLVANFKQFRLAASEAKLAGAALDMVLDSRAMELADIGNVYGRHSKFERGMQAVTDRFGTWALMNPWNAALKQFSSVLTQHHVLRAALKGSAMTAREVEQLAFGGIDAEMAARIAAQFQQHGEQGAAWVANTRRWTDREAVKHFRAAVLKDVDRTIVTPGAGDRPLWMSSEMGKLISQFHTFAMAAVQRVLVAGLQQRDMAVMNGTLLAVGLGMGVYALHGKGEKKDLADDPAVWVREGVDRSGITGWLYEAGNIAEKFTRGAIGPRALTGGEVSLRYADRGVFGALFGPTVGRVEDIAKATGAGVSGEFSESDVRALRRLIPFQNLFYMRKLFDQAQEAAAP